MVAVALRLKHNGTAVVVVCVTRRSNRPVNCPVRPGHCPGARRVWRVFLQSRYTADRAIERSRYKFYKWLKISHGSRKLVNGHMRSIAIQVVRKPENGHDILKLNYVQMRESGYINHYVTVMLADTKAKTVTNKLPQLTVLGNVVIQSVLIMKTLSRFK
jgi:hypothetical protein